MSGSAPSGGEPARVDEAVLAEQLAYYRARAPEYDAWFERTGRYDRGADATATWFAEVAMVRDALNSIGFDGADVLELAPGTGLWTTRLVALGARVTAVDAAPEMLDQLRRRGLADVTTIEADLFAWRPPRRFDAVVACFFVSHVPDERLERFARLLADAARPGGAVVLLDGLRHERSTAVDHVLPDPEHQTMERRLDDGRTYRVVKRFRSDEALVDALGRAGITATATRTPTFFQLVVGRRD